MVFLLLVSLGVSLLNPWFAIGVLFVGGFFWVRKNKKSYANPVFLMSFFGGFYYLAGGTNLSSYRGEVFENTMYLSFLFLFFLILGAFLLQCRRTVSPVGERGVRNEILFVSFIPGFLGLILMMPTGFPLFNPNGFTSVSGKAYFLAEFLIVPYLLLLSNCISFGFSRGNVLKLVFVLFLLSLSGYRGWPMMAIIISVIAYIDFERGRAVRYALLSSLSLFILLSGLSYFRRINNYDLMPAEELLSNVDAEYLGVFLGLMHLAFRESIAIGQALISYADAFSVYEYQNLFISDFLTMLPGDSYESGGVVVASMFGVDRGVGLTPGALGALVFDFGIIAAMFFAIILGAIIGALYIKSVSDSSNLWILLYLLIAIYIVHYMHRGIPKPGYLFIPLYFYLMIFIKKYSFKRSFE